MKYVKRARREHADLAVLEMGGIAQTTGKVLAARYGAWSWVEIVRANGERFDCNSTTLEVSTEAEYLRYLLGGRSP